MTDHSETMLPHDKDAEQGILGAILHQNDAYEQVSAILPVEAFFSPSHREIYKAMRALVEKEYPIDEITLADALKARNRLDQAGGMIYIAELLSVAPVTANVLVYSEIVLKKWQAREVMAKATEAIESIRQTGVIDGIADSFRKHLDDISQYDTMIRSITLAEGARDLITWLQDDESKPFHAHWHIKKLDEVLGGISHERPTVIAARTGMGKTTLLACVGVKNAKEGGVPTLFLNLEMEERTPIARTIAQFGDIIGSALLKKETNLFTWDSLLEAAGLADKVPFYIHTPPRPPSVRQLMAVVHWHIRNRGVRLVVLDHLSRFRSRDNVPLKGSGDYEEQTARMMALVEMMRYFKIPIVTGVQIGRKGEDAPTMADLKGSGDIEENCQVAMILHDDNPNSNEYKELSCQILKNGNGPKGKVVLGYWPYKFLISDAEERPWEPPRRSPYQHN